MNELDPSDISEAKGSADPSEPAKSPSEPVTGDRMSVSDLTDPDVETRADRVPGPIEGGESPCPVFAGVKVKEEKMDEDDSTSPNNENYNNNNNNSSALKEEEDRSERRPSPTTPSKTRSDGKDHHERAERKANGPDPPSASKRGGKKHRTRRFRKRKYKPYCKLTWSERMKLEERDTRRAQRLRDERLAHGLTLAPYNTTQFLMEDHCVQEPDLDAIHNGHPRRSHSTGDGDSSEDSFYSSPDDEEDFLHRQFEEDYDAMHDAHLSELSKPDLVREWIGLEDRLEVLQGRLRETRERKLLQGADCKDSEVEQAKIAVFREEIRKLSDENDGLCRRNRRLHKQLDAKT